MKSRLKPFVALLAAATLLFTLVACGSNGDKSEGASSPPVSADSSSPAKDPITITWLVSGTNSKWNNYHDSPVQQEIKRLTGATIELVQADDSKMKVLLASGDLPDVVQVPKNYVEQLVTGNHVIPLDDLIDKYGQDIKKSMSKALQFNKQNFSQGQNKTYFLPYQLGVPAAPDQRDHRVIELTIGPTVRWDYFKEIGAPAIHNEDELLQAIADMVAKHPKTEDGQKVYGVSGWSDWGAWPFTIPAASIYGWTQLGTSEIEYFEPNTLKTSNLLFDENGAYWSNLRFYYKANQMGILDPDMFTQKHNDFLAKATAGRLVYGPANWAMGDFNTHHAAEGKGFMVIPLEFGSQWNTAKQGNGMTGWGLNAISKNAKNPERIMEVLNFLSSYEGSRLLYSGVQGQHWDIVDGKPQVKPEVVALMQQGGEEFNSLGIKTDVHLAGLSPSVKHPDDGEPLDLFDTPAAYSQQLNPLQKDFSDHYGVTYPGEIFVQKIQQGLNTTRDLPRNEVALYGSLLSPIPDDLKRKQAKLVDLMIKYAPKVILSKNDAEYEANKKAAMDEFKASGGEEVGQWYVDEFQKALAKSEEQFASLK